MVDPEPDGQAEPKAFDCFLETLDFSIFAKRFFELAKNCLSGKMEKRKTSLKDLDSVKAVLGEIRGFITCGFQNYCN